LVITVSRPDDATVGVAFDVDVRVRNSGKRPSPPLRVTSDLLRGTDLLAPVTVYLDPVAPGEQNVLSVSRVPTRRGVATHSSIVVDAIAPFGFFTSRQRADLPHGLWVAPPAVMPIDLPGVLGAQVDGSGPMGPGLDVRGVREWRPGDAVRHVHWRSTARTGQLAVLDYGEPTVGTIGVLVGGTTASAADAGFEAALAVAAATALRAIDDGIAVVIAVEDGTGYHIDVVTPQSWHRIFAELKGIGVPGSALFDRLLADVGLGGLILVTLGLAVPAGLMVHLEYAATAAGAGILDTADYVDGRR
jgi:uncharacterized protein (DUF58 family)